MEVIGKYLNQVQSYKPCLFSWFRRLTGDVIIMTASGGVSQYMGTTHYSVLVTSCVAFTDSP